jgi:RNA polymerase primary sigma factor
MLPPLCRPHSRRYAPIGTYLRQISETPLLGVDEERELALRVGEGDCAARDAMVRANLRLVVSIARGYLGRGLPLEDLIAEGNLGLIRAVEDFDPSLGVRFGTYAIHWIKQSVRRAVVNTSRAVRLPAYLHGLVARWKQAAASLQAELGRAPTAEEVGARVGVSGKRVRVLQEVVRLHPRGGEPGLALEDVVGDGGSGRPDVELERADDLAQVVGLLGELPEREAGVLRLRFGLGTGEPLTLKEIGARLGLTRERVRQIEAEALERLRDLTGLR